MSNVTSSAESILLIRDYAGRYVPVTSEQILLAARRAIDLKMKRGAAFRSPETVKTFLQTKVAGFEHEMFAALFLDNQHRLIEYVNCSRHDRRGLGVPPRSSEGGPAPQRSGSVLLPQPSEWTPRAE